MKEQWTDKYKRSIDCDNPKGFSQRAHCQGKKKSFKEMREYVSGFGVGLGTFKPMGSMVTPSKTTLSAQKIKTPAIKPDFRSTGEKDIKDKQED